MMMECIIDRKQLNYENIIQYKFKEYINVLKNQIYHQLKYILMIQHLEYCNDLKTHMYHH